MRKQRGVPPTGAQLLSTLIDLLADQYGVEIAYEIKKKSEMNDLA